MRDVLRIVVDAWEALPGERRYSVGEVQAWLVGKMKPAIDEARTALETPAPSAWDDVLAERLRQQSVEGWTPEHDDSHTDGEIGRAAAAYALSAMKRHRIPIDLARDMKSMVATIWPWEASTFKPSGEPNATRRSLVKAAALLLAEIERLDRAAERDSGER